MIADYLPVLTKSTIFQGMDENQILYLLECLNAKEHSYQIGETIVPYGAKIDRIAILVQGAAEAVQEDFWGNQLLIGHSGPGETLADAFVFAGEEEFPFVAYAMEPSVILWIDYEHFLRTCIDDALQRQWLSNLLQNGAKKSMELLRKLEHIGKRTLREKLLSFFSEQAKKHKSNRFTIRYNRQELANFLGVDRSALSSELGRMHKDGLISFERSTFILQHGAAGHLQG